MQNWQWNNVIVQPKNFFLADYVNSLYDINRIKNQLISVHKKFDELQEEINCAEGTFNRFIIFFVVGAILIKF